MSNSGDPEVVRINKKPFFIHSAKVGDLDGDAHLDVVSLNIGEARGYDRTNIFLGNGDGKFDILNAPNTTAVEWKSHKFQNNKLEAYFGVSTVEVSDFNNDGVDEVLLGGSGLDQVKENFILVSFKEDEFKLNGAIIIDTDAINALSGRTSKIQNISVDKLNDADLDNDGDIDFVAKLFDHEIGKYLATVAFYNKNRTFNQVIVDVNELDEVDGQIGGNGPKFIDINDDGLVDIVKDGWLGAGNSDENFFLTQIHLNLGEELGFIKLSDVIGKGFYLGLENLHVNSFLFVPRFSVSPILAYMGGYKRVIHPSGAPKTYGAQELLLLQINGLPSANEIKEICKNAELAFCDFPKFTSYKTNTQKIQEHLLKHCPELGIGWVDGVDGPSTRKAVANLRKRYNIADEQNNEKTFYKFLFGPPDGRTTCE
jgi:peptidoglycan hydrolase-like protein with peptidoglycan-binding domain